MLEDCYWVLTLMKWKVNIMNFRITGLGIWGCFKMPSQTDVALLLVGWISGWGEVQIADNMKMILQQKEETPWVTDWGLVVPVLSGFQILNSHSNP